MASEMADKRLVDFDRLADLCLKYRCFQSPSLFHGVLTGQLCGQERLSREHWLVLMGQLLGDEGVNLQGDERQLALDLLDQTLEELSAGGLDFEPLLPDELYELEERFAALVKWLQGFLKSLKAADIAEREISAEAREGLEDLQKIVDAGGARLIADDDNEKDLTALAEFVRMVVMLLYTELHPGRPQVEKPGQPGSLH
ncbi:UPF0149 family protein [Marinospirillum alkaliphilum]|uniref:YecA family protein n=1 Tax=Marinospirillum alkaliphilum DSM 21637 TaxID=1122209 RepID=A0A1K1WQU2_9GAMM|nr:UPF0149 family protein [Marinospirillum alkaliphilum]SFX39467.1 hypothetical protein SAMN02745752_01499 [Marinospirillum alkaliphilum DSM 21637]